MLTSCKTTVASKTVSALNEQPPGFTVLIRLLDNENTKDIVMKKIYQLCSPVNVRFNTNNNFIFQETEIQIKIASVPDRQIKDLRNEMDAISGVLMIKVSRN